MTFMDRLYRWWSSWSKPPITPPVPPLGSEQTVPSGYLAKLLLAHNLQRSYYHVPPLRLEERLTKAAQNHADWMALCRRMQHNEILHSPLFSGVKVSDRILACHYSFRAAGENIAYGYADVDAVMAGWMQSPGHRDNIVNAHFTDVGFGVTPDRYQRLYWCAVFALPWGMRHMTCPACCICPPPIFAKE